MRVISTYFHLNVCKLYNGPIRLLADHDFTVRCIQVESIALGHWMVPLKSPYLYLAPRASLCYSQELFHIIFLFLLHILHTYSLLSVGSVILFMRCPLSTCTWPCNNYFKNTLLRTMFPHTVTLCTHAYVLRHGSHFLCMSCLVYKCLCE